MVGGGGLAVSACGGFQVAVGDGDEGMAPGRMVLDGGEDSVARVAV